MSQSNTDQLAIFRNEIDQLDESLIAILAKRFRVTQKVGQLKNSLMLPPVDPQREERQTTRIRALASQAGLREDVALKVLRVVIDEAVSDHKKLQRASNVRG